MQKHLLNVIIAISFLSIFSLASPVFSSISSMEQLGFSFGEISDPESDTLFVNPAYGSTVNNARISTNFFLGTSASDLDPDCWMSDIICPQIIHSTGFLDLHYLQPISPYFGFYLNATPIMRYLYSEFGPAEKYISADAAAGIWFRPIEKLALGFSGGYFSKRLWDQPGILSQTERGLDMYFLRAGFSMDLSSRWNLGYSIEYRPKNRAVSVLSAFNSMFYDTYIYPSFRYKENMEFLHIMLVRGRFNEILSLDNMVQFSAQSSDTNLDINSTLKIKTNLALFMVGLGYKYFNGNQISSYGNSHFVYHSVNGLVGTDIPLFSWLNLRIGMDFLYYSSDFSLFAIDPWFHGGVLVKFSDVLQFETNLTEIRFGNILPRLNFQLSYNFKK